MSEHSLGPTEGESQPRKRLEVDTQAKDKPVRREPKDLVVGPMTLSSSALAEIEHLLTKGMATPVMWRDDMGPDGFRVWGDLPAGGQLNVVRLALAVSRVNTTVCHGPIPHTVVLKLITR